MMTYKLPPKRPVGGRWGGYRPSKVLWFMSCAGSMIATVAIGFHWAGWTTAGSAESMARKAADEARDQLAAEICFHRFASAPDLTAHLALLRDAESWQRVGFLIDSGWVTIPGLHQPAIGAARLCASRLMSTDLAPDKATTGDWE
jgi:hypothetical protein